MPVMTDVSRPGIDGVVAFIRSLYPPFIIPEWLEN